MRDRRTMAPPHRDQSHPGIISLPGYGTITEIAKGTFATVYRAVELGTGRPVALKIMRIAKPSPHILDTFEKELSALALLSSHPNVTTLYRSFFTPMGRPVLVLELCRGSLAQTVREKGPLSPSETVAVGIKVAGALQTAHAAGFLHRDVKPQNILVSQFGEPVLADFGVAAIQAVAASTEGLFGFTTLHAPPEVLEGNPGSPAADIYSLGSSLYQLLVGKGPFAAYEGENPASLLLRILRDPVPPLPLNYVPMALADTVISCLDKEPERRPQSAAALAEALRDVERTLGWPQTPYVVWRSPAAGAATEQSPTAPGARDQPGTGPALSQSAGSQSAGSRSSGSAPGLGQPASPAPPPLFAVPGHTGHHSYLAVPEPEGDVAATALPPVARAQSRTSGHSTPSGHSNPSGNPGPPTHFVRSTNVGNRSAYGVTPAGPRSPGPRVGRTPLAAAAAALAVAALAVAVALITHLF
ncbi:MAG TPA: protein kinase [Acidimicrobiales bacterium]|nr:protein kinase [Acidimicrobiales bacterium]